jgi:hypothetical protein
MYPFIDLSVLFAFVFFMAFMQLIVSYNSFFENPAE